MKPIEATEACHVQAPSFGSCASSRGYTRAMKLIKTLSLLLLLITFAGGVFAREAMPARIPQIQLQDLPPQARSTLALIQRGGPFPWRRDGVVFQNRERRLPIKSRGYYREYTVPTPGSRDRGARRIVAGEAAEYYYSPDHYRSFQRIIQP